MNSVHCARGTMHVLRMVILSTAISAPGLTALAQQPSPAQQNALRQSCRADYQRNCAGVPAGGAEALACLQQHAAQTSPGCQQALRALGTSAPKPPSAAMPAGATASAAASPMVDDGTWPHTVAGERGSAIVYQPQIISWPDRRTLNTRIALGVMPTGSKTAVLGTIEVAFATQADLASRSVTLTDPRLLSSRFPTADTAQAMSFENAVKAALANLGEKRVPLDTILLSLRQQAEKPAGVAVRNDPPAIYYSARPASLLVFDGEPVLAPVAGTSLRFAVNTNWDVFVDGDTWYWLNNGAWLTAPAFKGPWTPVEKLPPAFSSLPTDANFAEVRKQVPGRRIAAANMPMIFVSTMPAEIIVTTGAVSLAPIPQTTLKFVANTDANVFFDTASGRYFYLVSGRWFSAPDLEGPWIFATSNLPADFARIPPNGPRGSVLVSVPGTPQAQEAVLQAQVPQQATLYRSTAKVEVVYSGPPKFEPVVGTQLEYAVNTAFDVIRVGETFYVCWQGAWFVAPSPNGPWVLAETVPAAIYAIPPSSPLYRVTYVRVYAVAPTTVTYGYTAGYTMGYVSAGVVVYGTGWYYPPVIWPAPVPIYYPYPVSYSGSTWYNATTGAWARGGTVYGPYGGAVTGGTAYNPNTGAWAHGAAVYGPNGGAGAWSAYNPSTGSYAHGSAAWGPDGGSANASWYNGRTGISGSTNQNRNQYGSWGSSVVSGPNQTVNMQHQSNAQGSAGSFKSSTGAEGAGVRGANGNSAGVVKGEGGNVYAGADGNVYRHTSDGWSKYDDGSWNSVQKPGTAKSGSGANLSDASSASTRASGNAGARGQFQGGGFDATQLNQDRMARTTGAERQQRYGAMQGGAAFSGGAGQFRGRR